MSYRNYIYSQSYVNGFKRLSYNEQNNIINVLIELSNNGLDSLDRYAITKCKNFSYVLFEASDKHLVFSMITSNKITFMSIMEKSSDLAVISLKSMKVLSF